ncbi:unnamed protein product [Dibothriocephalus latus]|uniref:SH3 domain-containing protein n=1 Tax=Dibothriocephalus latus TaxID=60516 RepID=A0A3P7P5T9_DIBLA|nr:unnamed protein product [Dibothriocephalus latus]
MAKGGEEDDSENTVIAVHNYNPVRENQLPLQKGEKYFVVNQSNAQWWYVRNMAGQAGYVPTNYIHKPNSLNSFGNSKSQEMKCMPLPFRFPSSSPPIRPLIPLSVCGFF